MNNFKSFSDYLVEEAKEVVFTFGRFNPPTTGHEKLISKVASIASGNNYRIYASQSSDPKKNPLDYTTKVKVMRKMFPKHGRNIILDKNVKNALDVLSSLYGQGFTKVTMVVGSDRVNEFNALANKYNGVKARHGFYNFENGINVVSAGERDPDAEGVEGMSASKMRAAAAENDFSTFAKGLPSGFKGGQELFDTIRKAMGINEQSNYHNHIQLKPISDTREAYVAGELFDEGDEVIIKESNEVGKIVMLGANYVLVEMHDGKKSRKWLSDIEKIEEKAYSDMSSKEKNKYDKPRDNAPESQYTKKFKDMFGEASEAEKSLKDKAAKTGISYSILKTVFDRGYAAWKSSHRPGTNPTQWGLARVNSFATGGKTQQTTDADLWKKHKGGK